MAKEVLFRGLERQFEGFVGAWSTLFADSGVSNLGVANKVLSRDLGVALESCYGCDLESLFEAAFVAELEGCFGWCRIDGIRYRESTADEGIAIIFGGRGNWRICDVSMLLRQSVLVRACRCRFQRWAKTHLIEKVLGVAAWADERGNSGVEFDGGFDVAVVADEIFGSEGHEGIFGRSHQATEGVDDSGGWSFLIIRVIVEISGYRDL